MKKMTYAKRQSEAKRKLQAKQRVVSNAARAVERLWSLCVAPENSFTEQERQSIADASHSLRGVTGGWINYRKVRL